ncbi:MAG TPA: hypothetical protein VGI85_15140 [Chthoniobacterales bacterium]|jgi:hypothetical protein
MSDSDPLLAAYLAAPAAEERRQLAELLIQHADPLIDTILRGRQAGGVGSAENFADAEDAASAVREQLIRQLNALREEAREPIRDFRAYVASTTYSAWAEYLRARHPQRALFLNRLRYVLENRTPQKGFALWADAEGAKWCGLRSSAEKSVGLSPKLQWLLVDPEAAVREAVGGVVPAQLALPDLLARFFCWLGGPIELRDLTAALGEVLGAGRTPRSGAVDADAAIDPRLSPLEDAVWKEYLTWLWNEIGALSDRQRRAFLLHSEVLREFELLGVASIRSIATILDLEAQELAALWNRLPLDDLTTAKMLACTRQQVINLRRVARTKLGDAWRVWNSGAGNKRAESPST